jgi:hypothetical protein
MSLAGMDPGLARFLARIAEEYPSLVWMLRIPELAQLFIQAQDENWSEQKLFDRVQQSRWWRETPATKRDFIALKGIAPGEATRQIWQQAEFILRDVKRLGIQMGSKAIMRLAEQSLKFDWDDATLQDRIVGEMNFGEYRRSRRKGGPRKVGVIDEIMSDIGMRANEYGINMSDRGLFRFAKRTLQGKDDEDGLDAFLREKALNRYGADPRVKDALDRGLTLVEYADPYLQMAVQELEVNPADVDLTDAKWQAFLDVDPKTGQHMNLRDWQRKIRNDPAYGFDGTINARTQAAEFATDFLQAFGAMG